MIFICRLMSSVILFLQIILGGLAVRFNLTDLNTNFFVSYEIKSGTDVNNPIIEFGIVANTTGWVAIGINDLNGTMRGSDMFIGGVHDSNSSTYGNDYHLPKNATRLTPILDAKQDWNVLSGLQNSTITVINFRRALNTKDAEDAIIQNKEMHVIWAYNSNTDDVTKMHTTRGSVKVNLLAGADVLVPTTPPPSVGETTKSDGGTQRIELATLILGILATYHIF